MIRLFCFYTFEAHFSQNLSQHYCYHFGHPAIGWDLLIRFRLSVRTSSVDLRIHMAKKLRVCQIFYHRVILTCRMCLIQCALHSPMSQSSHTHFWNKFEHLFHICGQ